MFWSGSMDRLIRHGGLVAQLRMPLLRNGYALMFSGAASSGLGMIYWVLAAHLYSAAALGLNSALLSALLWVAGVAQLSLNGALVRFTAIAGRKTRQLVLAAYLISAGLAALGGLIFVLGAGLWSPTLRFLSDDPAVALGFVLAAMIWCVFSLQDSALTGLRQAVWVPLENIAYALLKIALLVAVAGALADYGIFVSWTAPVALALLPVNLLIFRRFIPAHIAAAPEQSGAALPRTVARFVGGNYLGTLFTLTATTLLPIMVADLLGASANAYFYQPWLILGALQLVATNMTTSLTVEAMRSPRHLRDYCRSSLKHILRLLLPLVALIELGAPLILAVFGKDYAGAGATLLRLLALAAIPNSIILLYLALARVQNRLGAVIAVQGALCGLGLGLSYILLPLLGIAGVGIAWLASQSLVAVALLLTGLRPILWPGGAQQQARLVN